MSKNCKECINSRLILSENGWHAVCTLPTDEGLSRDCEYFENNELYLKIIGQRGEEE